MSGTFRSGDCLIYKTISLPEIQEGDVIIFCKKNVENQANGNARFDRDDTVGEAHQMEESQSVIELVHRVIALKDGGVVTRGDYNARPDLEPVTADNLVGIVTRLEREKKQFPVYGGSIGLMRTSLMRLWNFYLRRVITRLCSPPYQWLIRRNWASRIWHPQIIRIRLADVNGPVYKFISHGHIVAKWWPAINHFECQKPFDLILLREHLPR